MEKTTELEIVIKGVWWGGSGGAYSFAEGGSLWDGAFLAKACKRCCVWECLGEMEEEEPA